MSGFGLRSQLVFFRDAFECSSFDALEESVGERAMIMASRPPNEGERQSGQRAVFDAEHLRRLRKFIQDVGGIANARELMDFLAELRKRLKK